MSIPVPGSEELIQTIEPGQIVLANVPLMILGGVTFSLVNTSGHKIQQGDPGPDDHPVDSTIISRDNTGGGQVLYNRGDQDRGRYWDGDADAEHLEMLCLPPAITTYAGPNSEQAIILGQYPRSVASKVMAVWGDRLCKLNTAGDGFDELATFGTAPLGVKATNYALPSETNNIKMYIPCGDSFAIWDGTNLTGVAFSAVDMIVWQQKLFRLTQDGEVLYANTDPTVSGNWLHIGQICNGSDPRHLTIFYDRNNILGVNVVTDSGVFTLDFDDALLFESDQFWPRHPNFGWGVAPWRADLYISAGIGVQRQSNGFINAVGLDRDYGLPKELAGFIKDMEPSFNNLYALVQGETQAGTDVDTTNLRLTGQETMQGSAGPTLSSLFHWSGFGWHKDWQGQGLPTTVFVANPPGSYTVWWAAGNKVYSKPLTMNYYNPRETQTFPFAKRAEFITSRYNWGWIDIPKTAKRWETRATKTSATANVEIYYRIDDPDGDWVPLTTITSDGRQNVKFGEVVWDLQSLHYGQTHEWIQFRYVFNGDAATPFDTPYLEWWAAVGRKFLLPVRTWRLVVDVTSSFKDLPYKEAMALFEQIASTPGSQPFVWKDQVFMVDLTVLTGTDAAGNETLGTRTLTLIETDEVLQLTGAT